jgi:hypothetical protein
MGWDVRMAEKGNDKRIMRGAYITPIGCTLEYLSHIHICLEKTHLMMESLVKH